MISVPATALEAIKLGVPPIRLFMVAFAADIHRFASASSAVAYAGESWLPNTPLLSVNNVGAARQNGEIQLVLTDLALTWAQRFERFGERGKAVEVHDLMPHGAGLLFPMSVFVGRTLRAAKIRPRPRGSEGYRLSIECADAAVYSARTRQQWASDAFQRELAAAAGVKDNSMAIANQARSLVWHRA